jgi:hypothetical protein
MSAGTRLRLVSGGADLVTTAITIGEAEIMIGVGLVTVTSPLNLLSTLVCRFFHMRDSAKVIATRGQALPDGMYRTQSTKACEPACPRSNQLQKRVLRPKVIEHRAA